MTSSVTDLFNLALSVVGGASIEDENEDSRGAEVCRLWYSTTSGAVFRAAPWQSTTAYARLALLSERDQNAEWTVADPAPEWRFEYALPAQLMRPRYLTSFAKFDLGMRDSTHVLWTNAETPILAYSKRQPVVSLWDEQLKLAMAHGLAAHIAMPLTGKLNRARSALQVANDLISAARETSANEREPQYYDTPAPWLAVRGASVGLSSAQYFYPHGELLSLPSNDR